MKRAAKTAGRGTPSKRAPSPALSAAAKGPPLGRQAWLDTARRALIEEGTAGVEVNKLAKRLEMRSRSGFYWFFKNRAQLLEDLLSDWVESGTAVFERTLSEHAPDGLRQYLAITHLWIDENEYDPKWDGAVRDWARTSEVVRRAVEGVDGRRIALLEQMFQNLGYEGKEAHIRARVMYYHQVGYYAMGVKESQSERRALIPYYRKALGGDGRQPGRARSKRGSA